MKGYGLFVGVDYCDTNHYTDSNLFQEAKADAYAYDDLAKKTGLFSNKNRAVLTGKDATWERCKKVLLDYAEISKQEEGYLFLAFSAHGWSHEPKVQMIATNGNVINKIEFFSFYDRMVLENEVREILEKFSENFKIVLIVNACNSGGLSNYKRVADINNVSTEEKTFNKNSALYNDILNRYKNGAHQNYKADVFKFASSLPNKVAAKGGAATNLSNYTEYFMTVWRSKPFWGNYFTLNDSLVHGLQKMYEPGVWPDYFDSPEFFKRTVPFHFNSEARNVTYRDYMCWSIRTKEFEGEHLEYHIKPPTPFYKIRDRATLTYNQIQKMSHEKAYLKQNGFKPEFIVIINVKLTEDRVHNDKWFKNPILISTNSNKSNTGEVIILINDKDHFRILDHHFPKKQVIYINPAE